MDDTATGGAPAAGTTTAAAEPASAGTATGAAASAPTGTTSDAAAPGAALVKQTPGDTVTAKIQALHTAHFNGTPLANHTDLWNLVFEFKEKVISLVEEAYAGLKAKL